MEKDENNTEFIKKLTFEQLKKVSIPHYEYIKTLLGTTKWHDF